MPPAVPCVSECSSLATGTPAFVVVGRCSAAVMTKSPRLLVTVLELGLGGDGGQLLDGDGQLRVLVRLDSVRLGGERSQQVPSQRTSYRRAATSQSSAGCRLSACPSRERPAGPARQHPCWPTPARSARWPQSPGRAGSERRRDYPPSSGRSPRRPGPRTRTA